MASNKIKNDLENSKIAGNVFFIVNNKVTNYDKNTEVADCTNMCYDETSHTCECDDVGSCS